MSNSNLTKCPKCGSYNIMANRDIRNPWVQCDDCGYYLRKPNKMEGSKNKKKDKEV